MFHMIVQSINVVQIFCLFRILVDYIHIFVGKQDQMIQLVLFSPGAKR